MSMPTMLPHLVGPTSLLLAHISPNLSYPTTIQVLKCCTCTRTTHSFHRLFQLCTVLWGKSWPSGAFKYFPLILKLCPLVLDFPTLGKRLADSLRYLLLLIWCSLSISNNFSCCSSWTRNMIENLKHVSERKLDVDLGSDRYPDTK